MAKTSASCPQCHQPVIVDLNRLFDLNTDPEAKQKLLSGRANLVSCANCGYQGPLPTPIVYHDPEKELLLTFFPPELGVPVTDQEKMIGPMIKKVVDDLPMPKRKAYLFRPQTMLTQQHLFERILQADGITPEMMKAQQDRLSLIQRLAMLSDESLPSAIKQDDLLIDEQLFMLLSRLAEASEAAGDEASAKKLALLQQKLLENSTFGQKVQEQSQETQQAITDLQKASKKGLTREALLDLVIKAADKEIQLVTIVSMARSGMDYGFFQLLSDKLEHAKPEEAQKLTNLRSKLLDLTHEIDEAVKEQTVEAHKLLDEILAAPDTDEAAQKAMPKMSQVFVEILKGELQAAQKSKDQARFEKLAKIATVIQSASTSNAYIELIETLLQAPDDKSVEEALNEVKDLINDDFLQFLNGLTNQLEASNEQPEVLQRLKEINRVVLRFSMQKNLAEKS
jgi:hypothetical protein